MIDHAATGRREVALTFDDGPAGGTTPVLERLATHCAKATFFQVGTRVESDPAAARAVLAAGHEIGSHTWDHADHEQVPAAAAVSDMLDGAAAIERVLGREPVLYRAPYGHFVPATVAQAGRRGWACVGWTALGDDWKDGESGESVAGRLLDHLSPGAILVLHDGRREKVADHRPMLAALDIVLAELSQRELAAVTVSELLARSL